MILFYLFTSSAFLFFFFSFFFCVKRGSCRFVRFQPWVNNSIKLSTEDDLVDGNVGELDEETDSSENGETDRGGLHDRNELCCQVQKKEKRKEKKRKKYKKENKAWWNSIQMKSEYIFITILVCY